ncbi:flagellin [Microvirga brassicacearum]|uniref:Flagellin n=1 Tax=Microvirga brassicacearum TaxID=2580413 RepID=A0A5N3P3J7_9HYPH|nr:flagellin [Microvirga brassicacearum]KAB0264306.1 hypothetical protein FEZ63_23685 [Microvirga brassicacearum]
MASINTNLSALTALQSLKSTQSALSKTQGQISTGLRVGEASHNASYWSIATKMKSDNGALGAVKDSIKQSKAMLDTNTSAISKSLDYLNKMKEKLTAGSNPGANLDAIQVELKGSIDGLKSAASSASFNGQNWLNGDSGTVKLVTSYDGEAKKVNTLDIDTSKVQLFDDAANPTGGLLKAVSDIDIANPPNAQGYTDVKISAADLSTGDTLRVKVSGNTEISYDLVAGDTDLATLAANLNADATIGAEVEASVVDGKLRLTSLTSGKDVSGSFADTTVSADTAAAAGPPAVAGFSELTVDTAKLSNGDEISFSVDGGTTVSTFKIGSEKSIDELVSSMNADSAVSASVIATNDNGKLRLTAVNVANDVEATMKNVTKGVDTTNGQIAVADALASVDRAINDLREGSAMLGANKALLETQEEFVGVLSDSLTAGVSAFVDADMNEASTRLQALQTQQQLGVQALSIANQNSQMILKLFQ